MGELLSTPNFDGLPHLEKLTLHWCTKLEEIHPSLGNHTSLEYLNVSYCQNLKKIPTISQMKNIKTLLIMWCYLKDGEIPCGIGELSNLVELNLLGNSFTQLNFSLSQLTRLKCLDLSYCRNLLELPKLPSSLAILTADNCKSLTIVEDFSKYCNQLCQVSLYKYGWSDINLLQSLLKGNAIENGSMFLSLEGVEIPKGFTPALRRGYKCRLKLWCNDFSGFLICNAIPNDLTPLYPRSIRMKQVSSMDFNDDVVWEESDGDGDSDTLVILVRYVSFGSLRNTTWWDPTYKYLHFDILNFKSCDGFGVTLVDKKSTVSLTKTSSPYTPEFIVVDDSASKLEAKLIPYFRDFFISLWYYLR